MLIFRVDNQELSKPPFDPPMVSVVLVRPKPQDFLVSDNQQLQSISLSSPKITFYFLFFTKSNLNNQQVT